MAATRYETVNNIVNQVAVEVGLSPITDVFTDSDPAFVQLVALLQMCGKRLGEMNEWQIQVREHSITTAAADDGKYDLPEDFNYMIDQTGWERANNAPVYGPLSAQDWTYLLGRDLGGSTIFVSFRQDQNQFWVHPNDPVIDALDINFEYISKYWAADSLWTYNDVSSATYKDKVTAPTDIVLYPETLITRYLKLAFRQAKGFKTAADLDDFKEVFSSRAGKDVSAPILNAGRGSSGYPYLDTLRNVPDTGFGT